MAIDQSFPNHCDPSTDPSTGIVMQQETVFYLVHTASQARVKYYKTRTGARIAQRLRNRNQGFLTVESRIILDSGEERELCLDKNNNLVTATYSIVEDWIEINLE